jgi:hypothetical protein
MICSFQTRTEAVQFVDDLLKAFPNASASITTMSPEKFVVCFAPTVTDTSLVDTVREQAELNFLRSQVNT